MDAAERQRWLLRKARRQARQAGEVADHQRLLDRWCELSGQTMEGLIADLIEGQRKDPYPLPGAPAKVLVPIQGYVPGQLSSDDYIRICRAIQWLASQSVVTSHHPSCQASPPAQGALL